jgi:hypothetical protein
MGVEVVAVAVVVEVAVGVAMHGQVVVLEIQGEVEITEMYLFGAFGLESSGGGGGGGGGFRSGGGC